jgi:hypothetical protein
VNTLSPKLNLGRETPDSPMSPRVRSTQFLATACAITTKPSVHMTNEVARKRNAGMPKGRATRAANRPAQRKLIKKPVPKWMPMSAEA